MSTYTSEPGTRIAGRYRLVDQVTAGNGWTRWKAMDETLARPVSVLTFAPGFPRVSQVVTAARAASRLTDPRMAQVFDVEDGGGQAYIVLEWVSGETLTEMLAEGPLDPGRACSLVSDATRALIGAHALGQAHLQLTPDSLCWSRSSGIKITGLGIDGALAGDGLTGPAAYDPAVADTIALAALLYAALTGYWPGEQPARLPPAPVSDGGQICTPRQVSADVSSAIDSVVTRALFQRPTRQGPPITTPAAFADAISSVAPPVPLPEPAPPAPAGYQDRGGYGGYPNDPNEPDSWGMGGPGPRGTAPYPQRNPSGQLSSAGYGGSQYTPAAYQGTQRGGTSRVLIVVVVLLVLAVIGAAVWAIGLRKSPTSAGGGSGSRQTTSPSTKPTTGTALTPVSDSTFNILGSPAGNTEDPTTASNAIDGNPKTSWATSFYLNQPNFAGLKAGSGLLINMGKQVRLSQVEVLFGPGDIKAEIYLGNSKAMSPTALSNFTRVSPLATATGDHVFPVSSQATGQYVLIWITSLPPMLSPPSTPAGAKYQGLIYNVVVRGTAVSAAG
jgi:serine/threonine protein kinase